MNGANAAPQRLAGPPCEKIVKRGGRIGRTAPFRIPFPETERRLCRRGTSRFENDRLSPYSESRRDAGGSRRETDGPSTCASDGPLRGPRRHGELRLGAECQ